MKDFARLLIVTGIVLVAAGLAVALFSRLGLGKLPGDIVVRRGNFTFYLPIVTSIVLSLALSLLFWLFRR